MGIGMRDLQSPTGVWFPTGMDAVGVESWAIKMPAKVVKDEVKWQLGEWKAKYEIAKSGVDAAWEEYSDAPKFPIRGMPGEYPSAEFIDEWRPRKNKLECERDEAKPKVDLWQKWNTYLAGMPGDENLSLTKNDYEFFFADRDQREGKA